MQGLQGRRGWSGGSCGVVSWHDNMMTSARCSDPTCMYMYIHAHGRRPWDTTMSMQREDNTAVRKWAALGGMHNRDGRALSNWATNKAVQLAEFTRRIQIARARSAMYVAVILCGHWHCRTLSLWTANCGALCVQGAEFGGEAWSLSPWPYLLNLHLQCLKLPAVSAV